MKFLLFGGEPNSLAKGADSFMGSFETLDQARAWFEGTPARDPLTRIDWGQVAAWDGGTLRIVLEAEVVPEVVTCRCVWSEAREP